MKMNDPVFTPPHPRHLKVVATDSSHERVQRKIPHPRSKAAVARNKYSPFTGPCLFLQGSPLFFGVGLYLTLLLPTTTPPFFLPIWITVDI